MAIKIKKGILFGFFSAILITSYNNCSKGFSVVEGYSSGINTLSSVSGSDICETNLMNLFQAGYYQFTRTNCASCHATDADKPQFANPDVTWAYKVFMDRGYSKVSKNAISAAHQPPYTGPQNIPAINQLKPEWQKGIQDYNQCKGSLTLIDDIDPAELLSLETVQKQIPTLAVDQSTTVSWTINSDIKKIKEAVALPNLPKAQLSLTVTRHKSQGGEDYYTVTKPFLVSSTVDAKIKTMFIKINGQLVRYESTFEFIDVGIRANSTMNASDANYGLISTGALTIPGTISSNDMISVAFEKLEATVLPIPKPAVAVNFSGSQVVFVDSTTKNINLEIALGAAADSTVTLSLEEDGSSMCGATSSAETVTAIPSATCLPEVYNAMVAKGINNTQNLKVNRARSKIGNSFNRYDWDYQFITSTLTLAPSELKKNFNLDISDDIRHENNRILRLNLISATSNAIPGNNGQIYIVVLKADNPTPPLGEITFSLLMSTKGILNQNCVKCHNSRDLNGGYDMTDYNLMISRQVLIPGDKQSKMFRRLNATDPGNIGLTPMPLDGYMSIDKINAVSEWILNGAKNN